MECTRARQLAELYLDGTLGGSELQELRRHLDSCPGCRARVTAGEHVLGALPEALSSDAPSGMVDRIMSGVARDRRRRRRTWIGVAVGVFGTAAAVLLAVAWLRPPAPPRTPEARPSLALVRESLEWVTHGVDATARAPERWLEPIDAWVTGLGTFGDTTVRTMALVPEAQPLTWAAQAGRGLIEELAALGSPVLEPLTLLPMPFGKAKDDRERPRTGS